MADDPPPVSHLCETVQGLRATQGAQGSDATELEGEPDGPIGDHADCEDDEVGHDDVDGVLRAAEAGLDHGESGLGGNRRNDQ